MQRTATSEQLDRTFSALAHPARRRILSRLASGDASVTELAAPFEMSQPAVSKHLKVLEDAGLITGDAMPSGGRARCMPHRSRTSPTGSASTDGSGRRAWIASMAI